MLLKATRPKGTVLDEGTYAATVSKIKGNPDDTNPKRVVLTFKTVKDNIEVTKEVPATFDTGRPLRKDTETIIGRELNASEAQNGFDLSLLKDKPCQIVVMHKSGAGGRTEAVVSLVLKAAA